MEILQGYAVLLGLGVVAILMVLGSYRFPPLSLQLRLLMQGSPWRMVVLGAVSGLVYSGISLTLMLAKLPAILAPLSLLVCAIGSFYVGVIWRLAEIESALGGKDGAMFYLRWLHRGGMGPFNLEREQRRQRDAETSAREQVTASDKNGPA